MPKKMNDQKKANRYETLLRELGFDDEMIKRLVDEHSNDRVVSQGLSVRLKFFVPYREICRKLNMNFCAPLQSFMELFVGYFSDSKHLQEALSKYGNEKKEMEKAAPRTSDSAKKMRRERKPCDRV